MRIILFAAIFLLPISAVVALPLHHVVPIVPGATHHHHHPVTGKKLHHGLDIHQMHKDANIHKMPHQHVHDKSLVFPE
jgi:hypothetical protein